MERKTKCAQCHEDNRKDSYNKVIYNDRLGDFPFPDSPHTNIHVHPDAMCNLWRQCVISREQRKHGRGAPFHYSHDVCGSPPCNIHRTRRFFPPLVLLYFLIPSPEQPKEKPLLGCVEMWPYTMKGQKAKVYLHTKIFVSEKIFFCGVSLFHQALSLVYTMQTCSERAASLL